MKVKAICLYCDFKWEETVYSEFSLKDKICIKCKDRNLKFKNLDYKTIDYYQGSPPFEKKEEFWPNISFD